ncbi:hypothetical protein [Viridibacillus arvi]|uniref:hypothetical protein n=1 Tax=Viridibacillus arvi TaxID=263475 RepID=UPI00187B5BDD|nr:hypothetical protein [Viridibacillus sp. JNUCC-6]QOV13205.1 hypothetical protein JNUCC6_10930 [Viridibacillus sp. JNUCC-6]
MKKRTMLEDIIIDEKTFHYLSTPSKRGGSGHTSKIGWRTSDGIKSPCIIISQGKTKKID